MQEQLNNSKERAEKVVLNDIFKFAIWPKIRKLWYIKRYNHKLRKQLIKVQVFPF